MTCRHEGGTDLCVEYRKDCLVLRKRRAKKYYSTHRQQILKHNRDSKAKSRVKTGRTAKQFISIGYKNELLAAADLNYRCAKHGGFAYLNPAPQTKDDIFGKTSLGWKTFQVKTALLAKTKTGLSMHRQNCGTAKAEILVLIDDKHMRVKYSALRGALPPELPSVPTALCKGVVVLNPGIGGEVFPYLSSTARDAKRK